MDDAEATVMSDAPGRLMAALPAIFRATDDAGHLRAMLAAFESVLLASDDPAAPALAEQIDAIPGLFAPEGVRPTAERPTQSGSYRIQTRTLDAAPERFLPWLAQWVAFSPYAYFPPERLRRIVAGIVPLYGRRGTRAYLDTLLRLCFDDIGALSIDENPRHGLIVGRARIGEDAVLSAGEPFLFRVEMAVHGMQEGSESWQALEERVRAVIDFARPAHTQYELVLKRDMRGTPHAKASAHP